MTKYFRIFETHADYEAAKSSLTLPNVSICEDQPNVVHYNPDVPAETRVLAKFNVTDTSSPTQIVGCYSNYYPDPFVCLSAFTSIEIDGVELPSVVSAYTFETTGEHTLKYTLQDPTEIVEYAFSECSNLTSVTFPDGVTKVIGDAFRDCINLQTVVLPNSLTNIYDFGFNGCENLRSININADYITYIGYGAFCYCYKIDNATYDLIGEISGHQAFYCD